MALPQKATIERWGEVRFSEHGVAEQGRAVQADDPRLQSGRSSVTGSKIYPVDTPPPPELGFEGEFAFSKDRRSLWVKGLINWELMGYLMSDVTQSQAKVISPSGTIGTIEIAT